MSAWDSIQCKCHCSLWFIFIVFVFVTQLLTLTKLQHAVVRRCNPLRIVIKATESKWLVRYHLNGSFLFGGDDRFLHHAHWGMDLSDLFQKHMSPEIPNVIFQALFYLDFSEITTFLSAAPSWPTMCLFASSICYYLYDIWAMREQFRNNKISKQNLNSITSSDIYFYGFILHHMLCILGLITPIHNYWMSEHEKQCGRMVLFCFILGELPNIPRLAHKIIARRFVNQSVHENNTLHSIYFVFKGSFIWCRLGILQLTWNVMTPIAPFNVLVSAYMLNVFGIIAVCYEWRAMQLKNYENVYADNRHHIS